MSVRAAERRSAFQSPFRESSRFEAVLAAGVRSETGVAYPRFVDGTPTYKPDPPPPTPPTYKPLKPTPKIKKNKGNALNIRILSAIKNKDEDDLRKAFDTITLLEKRKATVKNFLDQANQDPNFDPAMKAVLQELFDLLPT